MVIPLWLQLACTLFTGALIPVNWRQYGPANFLWFSDIALFLSVAALWCESSLLASMAALAVLLPEIAWNLDYFLRLLTGRPGIGLSSYMFDRRIRPWVRGFSLFHVWLPILLVWMLYRFGYDGRALWWQTGVVAVVAPLSFLLGTPEQNVNWVYGFGEKPQRKISPHLFALLITAAFPVVIYLPTHFLLLYFFPGGR